MRHRRLASLLAVVSVVGLAATGCGSNAAAIRVGDETMSRRDFEDSVDFVYDNAGMRTWLFQQEIDPSALRADGAPPGVFTQDYVGGLAGVHVQYMVAEELVGDLGLAVTDDDRASVEEEMSEAVDGGFEAVPEGLRDDYIEGRAALDVLRTQTDTDAVNEAALEIAAGDVSVSSRYGSWDPDQFTVVPPAGPRPAPGTDPGDGSDLPAG